MNLLSIFLKEKPGMNWITWTGITLLIGLFALNGPSQGQEQKARSQVQKQKTSEKSSDSLSAKEKVLKARQLLDEAKNELYYNCCVKEPCDRCALDHQSCTCSRDLREGKGICSDCYAGWQSGLGKDIKGFTKENVKPNFHGHEH